MGEVPIITKLGEDGLVQPQCADHPSRRQFKHLPHRLRQHQLADACRQGVDGHDAPCQVPVALRLADIPLDRKAHDVTRGERRRLLETLKGFRIPVSGPRPIAEAIITAGGVKVGEVDPKTMQSKKALGLYFAGEVLDVDGDCGGYNLQWAWSSGHLAGQLR